MLIRLAYIFISFGLCTIIAFFNINILLLVETYPYLKFANKQFIVIHTTDLINVIWTLSTSVSFLFVFPFYFYQLFLFFKSSWYTYQIEFIKTNIIVSVLFYITSFFVCYIYVIPMFLKFLSQWEVKYFKNTLSILFDLRIFDYINWILLMKYSICCFIYVITLFIIKVYYLVNFKKIYKLIKLYKKQVFFINLLFLFILSPSDLFLQLYLIFLNFILIEFFYFLFFYITTNYFNQTNAYSTTTFKKF